MDKAQIAELLKQLDPAELRVLRYEVAGGHDCKRTTSLYYCCGEARCEACHVPHLKQAHDEAKLWAYEKFVNTFQLTWQGYVPTKAIKKPSTERATNHARPTPKVMNDPLAGVTDDNLEEVLALLAKKLGKEI